jgi:nicotinamidase-related amidase
VFIFGKMPSMGWRFDVTTERVWDRFLTEQDRARLQLEPARRKGAAGRPALLMVDLYRWAFGDAPEPLLEAIRTWPGSCGLAGWEALPRIEGLLGEARALGIPVVHVTGMPGVPGWRESTPRGGRRDDAESVERLRRRYDIVESLAPVDGELVLRKTSPSAFWGTPLVGHLIGLGIDTLVIAGESTSGCVRATVVDGKSYRFKVIVPEPCVFDRDEASHAINLYDIDQKYGDVLPLDEVLAYFRSVVTAAPVAPA